MQQVDDPPYLTVGTEVSAKYKGAFCEAKVHKVVRNIKCKVAYKHGLGSGTVSDDQIKGDQLRIGATVEVRHPERKDFVEAVITKIQDSSQYTVVFDDGDITTLRRSALCLKSGRHFNESETLDQLPLTHPEHFGNPVMGGRRGGRRSRLMPEDSSDDDDDNAALMPHGAGGSGAAGKRRFPEKEEHIGKVVCVENTDTKKKSARESRETWFPALVVAPTAQDAVRIRIKDEYLVRSFKDGRYYTVPKKEATEFRRDKHTAKHPQPSDAVQAALEYLLVDQLPPHWDRGQLFEMTVNRSSDTDADEDDSETSDDEPREEKDHFVAQLYKYMDDRGTPLNKGPSIANKDVDLYRLFRAVQKLNGYNKVTGQSQWKQIAARLGYAPVTQSIQNLVKQAYKKFLLPFEEFDRKLGCTMVAHPRANRIKGRNLLRANSVASPKLDRECKASSIVASTSATAATVHAAAAAAAVADAESSESTNTSSVESGTESVRVRAKRQLSTGSATSCKVRAMVDKYEDKMLKAENADSGDDDLLATIAMTVKIEQSLARDKLHAKRAREAAKESAKELLKDIKLEKVDAEVAAASASSVASAHIGSSRLSGSGKPIKDEPGFSHRSPSANPSSHSQAPPNSGSSSGGSARKDKQSKRPLPPSTPTLPSASAASDDGRKSTGGTVGDSAKKRRSEVDGEKMLSSGNTAASPATPDPNDFPIEVGDKLKVFYHEQKVTYEAKVIEISVQLGNAHYLVHYTGWNTRYDEWVPKERIAENLTNNRTNRKAKTGGAPSISKDKFIAAAAAAAASAGHHSGGVPLTTASSTAATNASSSTSSSLSASSTSSISGSLAPISASASATSKTLFKRGRGSSRGESQPPRSTTPSSVASNSSRTKSPATPATAQRRTTRGQPSSSSSVRRTSNNTDISSLQTDDSDTDSDEPVKKPAGSLQHAARRTVHVPRGHSLPAFGSTSGGSSIFGAQQQRQRTSTSPSATVKTATTSPAAAAATQAGAGSTSSTPSLKSSSTASSLKSGGGSGTKPSSNASSEEESTAVRPATSGAASSLSSAAVAAAAEAAAVAAAKGRDFDLKQIRSELKGLKSPQSKRNLADDGDADDDDDDDEDDEEDDEEATTTGDDTPDENRTSVMTAASSKSPSKAIIPSGFSDCPSSASNSDNLSDDHRTVKPTVSSDSADSEASDSFGDDDSQFSDKTTTLDNLTERLQEKYQVGKLHTDVFKKAASAALVPATVAPERLTEKVATLKPSGIEKIIKSTLAVKPKTLPEKPPVTKATTTATPTSSDRTATTPVKIEKVETKKTPTDPVAVAKSPNKSRATARSQADKSHFAERNRAAAAAAAAAIAAEKATLRERRTSKTLADNAPITTTPKKSGATVAKAKESPPLPTTPVAAATTATTAAVTVKEECDVYEFKEPEPFEFEAVKKISPESDKKAKKKTFAESVTDKLSTSPLSSTGVVASAAAAVTGAVAVVSKKMKKSPAKQQPTTIIDTDKSVDKPDKTEKPEKKPSADLAPLDVDTNMPSAPTPMASPPMLFSPTSSGDASMRPESIFDSLRKSPSFNLAQLAAQQNERDELMADAPSSTAAPVFESIVPRIAPVAIKAAVISTLVETVATPTDRQLSLITTTAPLSIKQEPLTSPGLPVVPAPSASPSTSTTAGPTATSSSSFASTSAAAHVAALAVRPKLPRPPSADTLKAFVSGPATSDNEDDSSVLQLVTVKQILMAGSGYEAPTKVDKPSSIADKVLKAINLQKCAAEAAAAAVASSVPTATTTVTTVSPPTTDSTMTTTTATSTPTATVATQSGAIVPGSAVPVSKAASVALTVATVDVRSKIEPHVTAIKTLDVSANKPILNSPDNSKQFSVDETKNQDLSDTIKKLRGVVQPTAATDADRRFVDDSDDSTGSERLLIEDSLLELVGSRESSLSGFECIASPKLPTVTPLAADKPAEKLEKESSGKPAVIAKKTTADVSVIKDNRRSGGDAKETKKTALKRPAEPKKSDARKSFETKETLPKKQTIQDSVAAVTPKPVAVEPLPVAKSVIESKPTMPVLAGPASQAVQPNIIRIEPMTATLKPTATVVSVMPLPVAVATATGNTMKSSSPSLADLNKLAPRVFASIMPLPEQTKTVVVAAGMIQQQQQQPMQQHQQPHYPLNRTHPMPSTIILNTNPPAPPLVPLTVRHDSPLITATTFASTTVAATAAVSVAVAPVAAAAVAGERPQPVETVSNVGAKPEDDDDDDDDLNDFENDKLVIVTKDDEDDDEDHVTDDNNGNDDDRIATVPPTNITTISIESSDPSASADSITAICTVPTASDLTASNASRIIIADASDQQHTQQKESLSLLMCEETIPGSPCPKEPTSGGNDTNTEDDEEPPLCTVAAAATKSTAPPKKRKSSPEASKTVSVLVAATATVQAASAAAVTGAHHVHPTASNMKSVPMDLEPSAVTKTTGAHLVTASPILAKVAKLTASTTPFDTALVSTTLTLEASEKLEPMLIAVSTVVPIAEHMSSVTVAAHVPNVAVIPLSVITPPTPTLSTPPAVVAAAAAAVGQQTSGGQTVLMTVPLQQQPHRRDSFSNDDSDDVRKNVDQSFAETRKRRRSKKASECESSAAATASSAAKRRKNTSRRNTVTGSESEDNGEYGSGPKTNRSGPAKPCQYNFLVQLDPALNSHQRISVIHKRIQDLRKTYNHLKGELASIDRRRKKLRRRDRETKKLKQRQIDCGGAA